jgi:nitrate/nitrite transport system substrate-binding protein
MKRRGKLSGGPLSTRREILQQTGKIILACSLPALPGFRPGMVRAAPPSRRPITVGIFTPSHCAAPYLLARARGYFKAEGLAVELRRYPTTAQIAADLSGGRLDFGQLITPLVFAMHTGAKPFPSPTPMVVVQITGTNGGALMIGNHSGISGPDDFVGKTVAIHSKLMVHYLLFMLFMESYGLDYRKDINFKLVELDKLVEALRDGKVDAVIMPEPSDAIIEENDDGQVYLLTKNIWPNHPCCSLAATRRFHDANREEVKAFSRALTMGALMANEPDHRDQLIDLLRGQPDFGYDNLPRPVLQRAFTPGRSDFQPFPYQSSARLIIEIMKKHELLDARVDDQAVAGEVFLSGLSREVMQELGATPPVSDYRVEKILGRLKDYGA